jgi:hypothetical protein
MMERLLARARRLLRKRDEDGYVLMAVTVFVFVLVVGGLAMYSTSTYETKHAMYTRNAAQAFYLADSAIERARAVLMTDRAWRDGWTDVPAAGGTYSLTVTDTTLAGTNPGVTMTALGVMDNVHRRLEVVAEIPPASLGLALLVMDDAYALRRLCVNGKAHIGDYAWMGIHDNRFSCGTYTNGFVITPPHFHTEPDYFPGSTYYEVRGTNLGGVYQARIFDRDGNDITTALGDSLDTITTYSSLLGVYSFDFSGMGTIEHYFDQLTGIFSRATGDISVVVNFGNAPLTDPPGVNGTQWLTLDGHGVDHIYSTIVNTRFTGVTEEQRLDTRFWRGGLVYASHIRFEPYNGIAVMCDSYYPSMSVQVGTAAHPALFLSTGGWVWTIHPTQFRGGLICLGSLYILGNTTVTYDPGFLSLLPDYMEVEWPGRVSGTINVLSWRELPAGDTGS